jgi:hypothetical protein
MTEIENLKTEIENLKAVLIGVIKVLRDAQIVDTNEYSYEQPVYDFEIDTAELYSLYNKLLNEDET